MRAVVIGGGVAGLAATWVLRRDGAHVTLFHAQAGASELGSGAADFEPWTLRRDVKGFGSSSSGASSRADDGELPSFLRALGCFRAGPALVATGSGVVRSADWLDPALLDLSAHAGARIAVADVERDDWDGPALARALEDSEWARRTKTSFFAVSLPLLAAGYERRIAPSDFAALHDEPARLERLLRACASVSADALVLGPWLGMEGDTSRRVRSASSLAVGEVTSPPGGVAGARFERARRRLLAELAVEARDEMVLAVSRAESDGYEVSAESGVSGPFDGVVLACGGLVGGGVGLVTSGELGGAFRLSFDAPVTLGFDAEAIEHASSVYGFEPTTASGAWIERVGILVDARGRAAPGIFAAGDAVANQPRTVLGAAQSGMTAGKSAAAAHRLSPRNG